MKMIKVKHLMLVWITVSTLIILVMLVSILTTNTAVRNEREAAEKAQAALLNAAQLQKGSDTLTYSVWRFAVSSDPAFASDYLYEKNISKSREDALSKLHELGLSDEALKPADNAKIISDELMQHELYAIRLIYEADHIVPVPDEVASVVLSAEDAALTDQQKLKKADDVLFGAEYQHMKKDISDSIAEFYSKLEAEISNNVDEAAASLNTARAVQFGSQLLMFFWLMVLLFMIYQALIKPLLLYSKAIETSAAHKDDHDLVPSGLFETRRLAQAYNALLEQVRENNKTLKQRNNALRRLSETDFLTNISSRLALETRVQEKLENDSGFCFSLLMLDLDHFKDFNDRYGHPMGDEALKTAAAILQHNADEYNGIAARIGGEEFMAVIPGADGDVMRQYAKRVVKQIKEAEIPLESGETVHITGSMGGYTYRGAPESLREIYRKADRALYHAKATGRAKFVAFDEIAERPEKE